MGVRATETMVIEDLEQFGFLERSNRLSRLVMIHKDDLETRWVEEVTRAGDAAIERVFVNDKVFIHLIAQDSIQEITDMPVGGEPGHICVGRVFAGCRHHRADSRIPGLWAQDLSKVLKETKTVDDAVRLAIFIHDRRHTARTACERPRHAQRRLRAEAI